MISRCPRAHTHTYTFMHVYIFVNIRRVPHDSTLFCLNLTHRLKWVVLHLPALRLKFLRVVLFCFALPRSYQTSIRHRFDCIDRYRYQDLKLWRDRGVWRFRWQSTALEGTSFWRHVRGLRSRISMSWQMRRLRSWMRRSVTWSPLTGKSSLSFLIEKSRSTHSSGATCEPFVAISRVAERTGRPGGRNIRNCTDGIAGADSFGGRFWACARRLLVRRSSASRWVSESSLEVRLSLTASWSFQWRDATEDWARHSRGTSGRHGGFVHHRWFAMFSCRAKDQSNQSANSWWHHQDPICPSRWMQQEQNEVAGTASRDRYSAGYHELGEVYSGGSVLWA